jgi:predicted metal-dependent hydrolase
MQVRNPKLAFAEALPHWAPNREFAQITNAGSFSLPCVETYLMMVMNRAARTLQEPGLKRDVALFTAQEGNHYRQHDVFNETLYARYPGLIPIMDQLKADYSAMLKDESLLVNAAYCEGFESVGLIFAEFMFEGCDDLLAGADERIVRLWQWHLAEEFEHRTVCYDVHKALGGGYLSRMKGFFRAATHLGKFGMDASTYMLSVDRESMSPDEREASIQREKTHRKRFGKFAMPRLLTIVLPGYDPRKKREFRGIPELLATVPLAAE